MYLESIILSIERRKDLLSTAHFPILFCIIYTIDPLSSKLFKESIKIYQSEYVW